MSASPLSLPRVAIVGGGISGLTCAHFLKGVCAIDLYERSARLGGHVQAVTVEDGVAVETGFLAFHRSRYPTLSALLDEFKIETGPSGVGLTIWDPAQQLCYRQSQWFDLFGTRLPAELRPQFSSLLGLIFRHEKRPEAHPYPNLPLADFLAERGCHPDLARQVLIPSISALWGFQPDEVLAMSTATVLESLGRFVGQTHDEPFERIVPSTDAWLQALASSLDATLALETAVSRVTPQPDGTVAVVIDEQERIYDAVVLATHADQALRLLGAPTTRQRELLEGVRYNRTMAVLHDDPWLLPTLEGGNSEYTYALPADAEGRVGVTTWDMQKIQGTASPWYVTVGPPDLLDRGYIDAARIRFQTVFEHPAMTPEAIAAQASLPELNDEATITFCGSYFGVTGSNECAVASAKAVAERLRDRFAR